MITLQSFRPYVTKKFYFIKPKYDLMLVPGMRPSTSRHLAQCFNEISVT